MHVALVDERERAASRIVDFEHASGVLRIGGHALGAEIGHGSAWRGAQQGTRHGKRHGKQRQHGCSEQPLALTQHGEDPSVEVKQRGQAAPTGRRHKGGARIEVSRQEPGAGAKPGGTARELLHGQHRLAQTRRGRNHFVGAGEDLVHVARFGQHVDHRGSRAEHRVDHTLEEGGRHVDAAVGDAAYLGVGRGEAFERRSFGSIRRTRCIDTAAS